MPVRINADLFGLFFAVGRGFKGIYFSEGTECVSILGF